MSVNKNVLTTVSLTPKPKKIEFDDGSFTFSAATAIRFDRTLTPEAAWLAMQFKQLTESETTTSTKETAIKSPASLNE